MAKALGLIGNFKGKLGNTVGYSLKDSNNKQTQGVRVYQPIVRNPKTFAQAVQRCKLTPINATYRLIKNVIDRGYEGLAYGNKSRLAFLAAALKSDAMPYVMKGQKVTLPSLVAISRGSLANPFEIPVGGDAITLNINAPGAQTPTTIAALTEGILALNPSLKEGDQITFVEIVGNNDNMSALVRSIVLDSTDTSAIPSWLTATAGRLAYTFVTNKSLAATCIISREGSNGQHLRSTSELVDTVYSESTYQNGTSLAEAAKSYMNEGSNTDWAEESLVVIPESGEEGGGGEG